MVDVARLRPLSGATHLAHRRVGLMAPLEARCVLRTGSDGSLAPRFEVQPVKRKILLAKRRIAVGVEQVAISALGSTAALGVPWVRRNKLIRQLACSRGCPQELIVDYLSIPRLHEGSQVRRVGCSLTFGLPARLHELPEPVHLGRYIGISLQSLQQAVQNEVLTA